jgi:hypothetical protein
MKVEAKRTPRCDDAGRAYKGSQLQVQLYTNRRQPQLAAEIVRSIPAAATCETLVAWLAPLEVNKFIELRDGASIEAFGLASYVSDLKAFWPRSGPR